MNSQAQLLKIQTSKKDLPISESVTLDGDDTYIEQLCLDAGVDRLFVEVESFGMLKRLLKNMQTVQIAQLTAEVASLRAEKQFKTF